MLNGVNALVIANKLPDQATIRIENTPISGGNSENPFIEKSTLIQMLSGPYGKRIAYDEKSKTWFFIGNEISSC